MLGCCLFIFFVSDNFILIQRRKFEVKEIFVNRYVNFLWQINWFTTKSSAFRVMAALPTDSVNEVDIPHYTVALVCTSDLVTKTIVSHVETYRLWKRPLSAERPCANSPNKASPLSESIHNKMFQFRERRGSVGSSWSWKP
mmetsp:Transcript_35191/g.64550  ORF Transcript_35191/g.64550 Transcript_35191/m.64550 type:complete len:141 (-) Transcript_35191:1522-1944(-)